ncbi:uncharacterized protein BDR25DRAFT_345882 [Lindgomyces ingoldianus]|uniref:Uncharacterized protein n=1 Tax=Lindgomyces ingoldianus TaxID=673940 RepID=A0ACB6QIP3_9PLEO|nr:uncharacterized protein BDR25DRAFT_345882 [Lindgomyces ingoldianus]KAF2466011.1 hypothetical protein BDR25DRAFT_345882 [Lindgomyces ingoldianus]
MELEKAFFEHTGHKPLLTRALIEHVESQRVRIRNGEKTYIQLNLEGNSSEESSRWFQDMEAKGKPITIFYNHYQEMAKILDVRSDADPFFKFNRTIPIHFVVQCPDPEDPKEFDLQKMKARLEGWEQSWNKSVERQKLLESVQTAKSTVPINKIIGLGLGSGNRPYKDYTHARFSYCQHLAACDIALELQKLYGPDTEPIEIFGQDPEYTPNDKVILAHLNPPIATLEDPYGFLAIDKTTFVMSVHPNVPVRQIIADLALESNDACPAGVLWNYNPQWREEGGDQDHTDPCSSRVEKMLEGFVLAEIFEDDKEEDRNTFGKTAIWFRKL